MPLIRKLTRLEKRSLRKGNTRGHRSRPRGFPCRIAVRHIAIDHPAHQYLARRLSASSASIQAVHLDLLEAMHVSPPSVRRGVRLMVVMIAVVSLTGLANAQGSVERGAYLVNLLGCHDCHTPRGPDARL
jgi:hypothetical protein